jgi:hypothetical protein
VLGIFRVHGLALIRRFLLAERDLMTFPDLPALSAQIRGAHAALQVRLRPVRKRGVRPLRSDKTGAHASSKLNLRKV